jgi:hypothetical protein
LPGGTFLIAGPSEFESKFYGVASVGAWNCGGVHSGKRFLVACFDPALIGIENPYGIFGNNAAEVISIERDAFHLSRCTPARIVANRDSNGIRLLSNQIGYTTLVLPQYVVPNAFFALPDTSRDFVALKSRFIVYLVSGIHPGRGPRWVELRQFVGEKALRHLQFPTLIR